MDITYQQLVELNNELRNKIVSFLYKNLGEYTDDRDSILESLLYVENSINGGCIFTAQNNEQIIGIAVVAKAGMQKFIPENILIHLAVDQNFRGLKISCGLLNYLMKNVEGNIALHVE